MAGLLQAGLLPPTSASFKKLFIILPYLPLIVLPLIVLPLIVLPLIVLP
jgi:hypothetical protein